MCEVIAEKFALWLIVCIFYGFLLYFVWLLFQVKNSFLPYLVPGNWNVVPVTWHLAPDS